MADTARGGLNYGMNVSGNFDSEFQSFISQAKALKKEVRSIRDVFKSTSGNANKARAKGEKDALKTQEKQTKEYEKQEQAREKSRQNQERSQRSQEQGIKRATKAQRGFQQSVQDTEKSGTRLLFTFRRLVGILAVFTIARELTTSVVAAVDAMKELNKETETTISSVASLIATVGEVRGINGELLEGIDAYNASLSLSTDLVNQLKVDAAAVGVELEAALTGIRAGLAPGLSAGLGLDDIRTTTLDIVRAARLLEVPAAQVAEEVRSILSGTIRLTTTRLAPLFDNEQIRNAREQGNLLEVLQDGLRVFNENAESVSQTYQGLAGSVNALGKEILRSGGVEYFNALKDSLGEIKGLLADGTGSTVLNPEAVDIVRDVAEGLTVFVQEITEVIKSEAAFEAFATTAELVGAALETAGRVGSEALDLLLKTADKLLPPFTTFLEVLNSVIETLDDAGILGAVTTIASGFIAWKLTVSQILVLKTSLLGVMQQTSSVTTQVIAQERARVSLGAQLGVQSKRNNSLLGKANSLYQGLNIKAAAFSALTTVGIGALIVGITQAASTFGKVVERTEETQEILKKAEDISKGLRNEIGQIPPALIAAVRPTKEIQKGLEKLEESSRQLRANLRISAILQNVEGSSRKALEVLLATTDEADKLNKTNALRLKQNQEQQKVLEQNAVLANDELRALAKQLGVLDRQVEATKKKNQDDLDVQKELVSQTNQRNKLTTRIKNTLIALGDDEITREDNLRKAQTRRLAELKKAQEETGRRTAARPSVGLGTGIGPFQAAAQAQTRAISGVRESNKLLGQRRSLALDIDATNKSINAKVVTRIGQIQSSNALKAEEKSLTDAISTTEEKITENAELKAQSELLNADRRDRSNKLAVRLLDIEIKGLEDRQSLAEGTENELQAQLDVLDKQIEREEKLLAISKEDNKLVLSNLQTRIKALPEGDVRNELEKEYDLILKEQTASIREQETSLSGLNAQRDKATQDATTGAIQTDLAADKRSLQLQSQIADRREQISRVQLETSTLNFPGAEREAILAQQTADAQQRKLDLTEKTLDAQRSILQAEIQALPAGEERTKKQQELADLQLNSISLLDLERAKLVQLQAQAQESAFFTSQSFTEGLNRGFEDFIKNTEATAPQIADIISGALVDVSGVVADVFKDAIDPRTSPDIKTAFGEFFLDLAGQLVQATTQQLTKGALGFLGIGGEEDSNTLATTQNTIALQSLTTAITTSQSTAAASSGGSGGGGGGIIDSLLGIVLQFFNKGGQVQSFDTGGSVAGTSASTPIPRPSNIPKSDTVPAWLTPGEVIMQPSAVEKWGAGFLLAMNEGIVDPAALLGVGASAHMSNNTAPIKHFAGGGMVGSSSTSRTAAMNNMQAQQVVLPVLPANNRTMEQLVSGGNNSFKNGVNDTDMIGDPNKSGGW